MNVQLTCVVLVALGDLTQQLGHGGAHSLGAGTQILGTFLKLSNTGENKLLFTRFTRPEVACYDPVANGIRQCFSVPHRLSWQRFEFAFLC